jgi:hypothetical protein
MPVASVSSGRQVNFDLGTHSRGAEKTVSSRGQLRPYGRDEPRRGATSIKG